MRRRSGFPVQGQGILILAWLETRDQFNPFALRASEDFPVDVDRPT
jgi:hypothetical protein